MPIPYFLKYENDTELYRNKTKEEKQELLPEMVKYTLVHGNKPTAWKYHTYPSTVRRWVRIYNEYGIEGLKIKDN